MSRAEVLPFHCPALSASTVDDMSTTTTVDPKHMDDKMTVKDAGDDGALQNTASINVVSQLAVLRR